MNEISLLNAYGPQAAELSDAARRAARERLLAECRAPGMAGDGIALGGALGKGTRIGTGRGLRRRTPRWAFVSVGLAIAAMTAGVLLPALWRTASPGQTADPIRLVAAAAFEFPYALPGLGKPSFTAEPGGPIMAVYPEPDGSEVVLTTTTAPTGEAGRGEREITLDGRPGRITVGTKESGVVMFVALTWEHRPGVWLSLTRAGENATEKVVLTLAREVTDQPQEVGLMLTVGLVPDGWRLGMFKDDGAILSYIDPAVPSRALTVWRTPQPDTSPDAEIEGFEAAQAVTVGGRPARLVRTADFWRLTATLPDGSGVNLMAPRSFRSEQVVAVAESVRLTMP
ncbi:hypothetical protein HDA40_007549 [Hamadaea flava]|uniref:DUF4367 domain-containing protein n=1 Tax=Hamadaea flava TaxID=1742688 RepID=A0ABV8M0Y4_9ACTN|nr:hypothetical protein [Hamadaea flava]MCP2329042.1 hypothetical protein [Hamadaea flava]